jgi:hypothetical protein
MLFPFFFLFVCCCWHESCCVVLESLESADYTHTDWLPCCVYTHGLIKYRALESNHYFPGISTIAGKSSHFCTLDRLTDCYTGRLLSCVITRVHGPKLWNRDHLLVGYHCRESSQSSYIDWVSGV